MTQLQTKVAATHRLPRSALESRFEDRRREALPPGPGVANLLCEVERVIAIVEFAVRVHEGLETFVVEMAARCCVERSGEAIEVARVKAQTRGHGVPAESQDQAGMLRVDLCQRITDMEAGNGAGRAA